MKTIISSWDQYLVARAKADIAFKAMTCYVELDQLIAKHFPTESRKA